MKKVTTIFCTVILLSLFAVNFSYALLIDTPAPGDTSLSPSIDTKGKAGSGTFPTLQNPLKANSITEVLADVVDLAIFIGVVFAVLMFIYIGFKFVLAQGNETKLKEAKMWFLYAVVGTAVLISSKLIVEVIKSTLISAGVVKNF